MALFLMSKLTHCLYYSFSHYFVRNAALLADYFVQTKNLSFHTEVVEICIITENTTHSHFLNVHLSLMFEIS